MSNTFRFKDDVRRGWKRDDAQNHRKQIPVRFPELCIVCSSPKVTESTQEFRWGQSPTKVYELQVPYCAEHDQMRQQSDQKLAKRSRVIFGILYIAFLSVTIPFGISFVYGVYRESLNVAYSLIGTGAVVLVLPYSLAGIIAHLVLAPLLSLLVTPKDEREMMNAFKVKHRETDVHNKNIFITLENDMFAKAFGQLNGLEPIRMG